MSSEAQVALIVGIMTAVVGLITAVAALAGALGGTFLGWVLNRRTQTREEKRAAFVEFLSAILACQWVAMQLNFAVVAKDQPEIQRQHELMRQAIHRVDTAQGVVALVLPARRHKILEDAVNSCGTEFQNAIKPGPWETILYPTWQSVLALAQEEIGTRG